MADFHGAMRWVTIPFAAFLLIAAASGVTPLPSDAQKTTAPVVREPAKVPSKSVAAARIPESSRLDRPCAPGVDTRSSELCAQWKAADASEQSARYALWALIVSAIGTVLLVWTLAETRATSRRELRAYVSVKVRAVQAGIIEGRGLNVTFDTVSHNGGQTPAYDCVHFGTIAICRPEDAKSNLSAVKPIDANEIHGGAVIHSGEDFPVENTTPYFIPLEMIRAIETGAQNLYVFGVASYRDTFGIRRRTDYCYSTGGDAFGSVAKMTEGEPVPIKWNVTAFHNRAT